MDVRKQYINGGLFPRMRCLSLGVNIIQQVERLQKVSSDAACPIAVTLGVNLYSHNTQPFGFSQILPQVSLRICSFEKRN